MAKRIGLWMVLFVLLCTPMACAQEILPEEDGAAFDAPLTLTAQDLKVPEHTVFPVYSAPFEDAWRGAKGKAAVSVREPVLGLAATRSRNWLMIEYEVTEKEGRIGWIRIGEEPEAMHFEHLRDWEWDWEEDEEEPGPEPWNALPVITVSELAVTSRRTQMTDDPRGGKRTVCTLEEGVRIGRLLTCDLGRNGTWAYIRTEIDGKPACGFVPSGDVLCVPAVRLEGNVLHVADGVEFLTGYTQEFMYKGAGPAGEMAPFGMIHAQIDYEQLWEEGDLEEGIGGIALPDTLRLIGDGAIAELAVPELVIPEGVQYLRGFAPFMFCSIGTLRLPSTLADFECGTYFCWIGAYAVSEENPNLKAEDGVLYSRDGRVLLAYPSARAALHYDVAKGTKEIHDMAFYTAPYYDGPGFSPIDLVSLSLPVGLERIGYLAFYNLDNLVSLSIPPTVREMDEQALGAMASLSSVSIPPWLAENASYQNWLEEHEHAGFTGDNGPLAQPESDEEEIW